MSLIIENGSGVASANGYVSAEFVLTYLTDRNRQTENDWDSATTAKKEAAIVASTDYVETEFGKRFLGKKEFSNLNKAKGTLTLTANPLNTEPVTIGSVVYIFNTSLGGANSILIGANTSVSLDNLLAAINLASGIGTLYGTGTVIHPDVIASLFDGDEIVITAKEVGTPGNLIVTTTTVTGGSWVSATLIGGIDIGKPQPLSFPRLNLFDLDGIAVLGIPQKLKQSISEYAVRSISSALRVDPTDTGSIIMKHEIVGPIEEETRYSESMPSSQLITSYPAADKLLSDYLKSSGELIRA